MEPWGIIMTGFTLFGMLVLAVASAAMEDQRTMPFTSEPPTDSAEADTMKRAA